jgi:hypothetical protein
MDSMQLRLAALSRAGRGALMLKLGSADAYEHEHVRPEDFHLQGVS